MMSTVSVTQLGGDAAEVGNKVQHTQLAEAISDGRHFVGSS